MANGILQQAAISLKHSMCSHRARSSRSMGSKLLRFLGESLFHPLFEKMLTAQILQGAGRTYIDGSILIFFLFGFDPYSDPYHGKTGRHALTSNKIYFSKKSGIATLSGTWSNTPAHGKTQYIPVQIPPSAPAHRKRRIACDEFFALIQKGHLSVSFLRLLFHICPQHLQVSLH